MKTSFAIVRVLRNLKNASGVILAVLCFFLFGCTFDYDEVADGESEIPAIAIHDPRFVRIEDGRRKIDVTASRIEHYTALDSWYGEDVVFSGYNSDEAVDSLGKSRYLFADSAKGEYIFAGGVYVNLVSDGIAVDAENLFWDRNENMLYGDVSERVTVHEDSGTEITGIGFQADALAKRYFFARSISGTIIADEKDSDNGSNLNDDQSANMDRALLVRDDLPQTGNNESSADENQVAN